MIKKSKLFGLAAVITAIVVIAIVGVGVTSCSGTEGPIGPEGPQGPNGESGLDGLDGADGSAGADGTPSLQITYTITYDSAGGSGVDPEKVIKDGKANVPETPVRSFTSQQISDVGPGLYLAGDGGWLFTGWYLDGVLYKFDTPITSSITLTARWSLPSRISDGADGVTVDPTANDFLEKAIAYVVAHPANYILGINRDYSVTATVSLPATAANLTIIGIGGECKVTSATPDGRLTNLNNGGSLVIGNNITVVGKNSSTTNLFTITNGTLNMQAGSKITGFITSANVTPIHLEGSTARFNMNGGEISDNRTGGAAVNYLAGAVAVFNDAIFTMAAGEIKNNETRSIGNFIAGAVLVRGASFTMNGGTITGNKAEMTTQQSAGGVLVGRYYSSNPGVLAVFNMNNGTITGNSGAYGDVLKTIIVLNVDYLPNGSQNPTYLRLNNGATIGTLTNNDIFSNTSMAGNFMPIHIYTTWTGEIDTLNLMSAEYTNITGATNSVMSLWLGKKVVEGYTTQSALTNAHIAQIKHVYFMNNVYGSTPVDISTANGTVAPNGYQISTASAPATKGTLIAK
jgi:hypothetical protein